MLKAFVWFKFHPVRFANRIRNFSKNAHENLRLVNGKPLPGFGYDALQNWVEDAWAGTGEKSKMQPAAFIAVRALQNQTLRQNISAGNR